MKPIIRILIIILPTVLSNQCENDVKPPSVKTLAITSITSISASSGGYITSDGGAEVTARGVCWGLNANPTTSDTKTYDGNGTGLFKSSITGLTQGTTYYVRAYATNSVGTEYGSQVSFSTNYQITDIDNNIYNTVTIGTQTWMVENLKTTRYRDGSSIPEVKDAIAWGNLTSGAFCWYNNDQATYKNTYGALYNFYTTQDSRHLCPSGWHVPTRFEWETLADYLGGESIAAGKLKETGTVNWKSPNTGATNECGFTALPGGTRGFALGDFYFLGEEGEFWSSTHDITFGGWYRWITFDQIWFWNGATFENNGFSVRCLKD
jgi:uncharacterized protein (TIGR02145 family)